MNIDIQYWHPWLLVASWVSDWTDAHPMEGFLMAAMRDYCKRRARAVRDQLDAVNANPLHESLVYPAGYDWVMIVLRDMADIGWLWRDRNIGVWCGIYLDCLTDPAEWLAVQPWCDEGMQSHGIDYDRSRLRPQDCLRLPVEWFAAVGLTEEVQGFE